MDGKLLTKVALASGLSAEVRQHGRVRSLWLSDGWLQTEIDLDQAGYLPNPVSRAMLAHLPFVPPPRNVALLGGGGGGIARWFAHHDPTIAGVAVEISPQMATLAHEYFDFPGEAAGWRLEVGDVREYLNTASSLGFDFMLADIGENDQTPAWLVAPELLLRCRHHLTAQGVLTVSLVSTDATAFVEALANIRTVFARRTVCMAVPGYRNVIVMAFNGVVDPVWARQQCVALRRRWGLDFEAFMRRMAQDNPAGSGVF